MLSKTKKVVKITKLIFIDSIITILYFRKQKNKKTKKD